MPKLTTQQRQNILINYGLVYINWGKEDQRRLAPTRGGATITITPTYRDIDYDGSKGKEKGMQILESVAATATVPLMDMSMENLALLMPYATLTGDGIGTPYKLTVKSSNIGLVQDSAYLDNITIFGKKLGGNYVKVTLHSAMNEGAFTLTAAPKAEGVVNMEIHAHWDAEDDTKDLVEIEDVETISDDSTPPTATTVPDDGATSVVVSSNLTATFSEAIRQSDIHAGNFILVKVSDGSVVSGDLSYEPATKTVTFDPTSNLEAGTAYLWLISNVRDLAGNKMTPKTVNFTTAA
jgi:hypothetical protein